MGEEVFQLQVATPICATCPMSLYKARQETSSTVSFPAGAFNRVFFSLLVLYKFPTLKILPWQVNKMVTGHKNTYSVDRHQMIITAKYGSHHFTGYGENAF